MKILTYLLLLVFFFLCQKQNENIEKKVLNDIFLDTVDSTLIDRRIYLGFDYSKKQIDSIKKDPSKRIIAISENLTRIYGDDLKEIPQNYKIKCDSTWKIQPEKFNSTTYIFKKINELPFDNSFENWNNKYKTFSGVLSFSQIYFDDNLQNGIFAVTYSCSVRCAVGYLVYITKDYNKWKIKEVRKTWIS